MERILSESSSDGSVASAREAYRNILVHHGLMVFSRQEVKGSLATLQSQGCVAIKSRDIRFQAAVTRLKARKDISSKTVDDILQQLMHAEYDLDQAEWERDCHQRVSLLHATFTFRPPV